MRRSYGTVTVDLPRVVTFLDPFGSPPIFHRISTAGHWLTTGCGEWLWRSDTEQTRQRSDLPVRHAVKFGRPCSTCWPELRAQPALFQRTPRTRLEHRQMAAV
jgi:hypothetical protein